MKRVIINAALFVSALMFAASCNTRHNTETEDSKEAAEDLNAEKFPKSGEDKDAEFAVKAADGGMLEVKLGELAQTKGMSKEVKDLGKMLVEDHSKANEELKAFALAKDISLPTSLSDENQKMYDKLASKDGKDFDQAFTDHMVKGHKKDIDAFKKEASDGHDPDIRQWASGKVPTLEHHLDMAKSAEDVADHEKKSTGKLD